MTPAGPPLPPDVMAQQLPAPLRFMQAAGVGAPAPEPDPMLFAVDQLNQIAASLKNVADVLIVKKPALMPILQHMSQAGSALMNELQASAGAQGPAPGQGELPTRPQFAQPDGTAGAISMS